MEGPKLNAKRQAFVEAYCRLHQGRAAAIAAGYTAKSAAVTASRLLAQPHIRAAVEAREAEMADHLGMTAQWVLEQLQTLIVTAMTPTPKTHQGEPVTITDPATGKPVLLTEIDGSVAHRALETVMRHRGMLTDRAEITVDASVEYTLALDGELAPADIDEPDDEPKETP